ncbi:hypothetical protein RF11_07710 [Thelohanellus kitauei]|uniref:Uncharacterized protein n=1 Tax=Thelohanellus kitauei TaxID=669202 RepID=A0A0C2N061_THEKT|nr:hypothetical protein RF11_07710 [Thelohanellus kitauei]
MKVLAVKKCLQFMPTVQMGDHSFFKVHYLLLFLSSSLSIYGINTDKKPLYTFEATFVDPSFISTCTSSHPTSRLKYYVKMLTFEVLIHGLCLICGRIFNKK